MFCSNKIIFLIVTVLIAQINVNAESSSNPFGIVPQPQFSKVEPNKSAFHISSETQITYNHINAKPIAELLREKLQPATGFDIEFKQVNDLTNATIQIQYLQSDQIKDEAYTLEASSSGVTIQAHSVEGLQYGVQTLLQLLPSEIFSSQKIADHEWAIPACVITDHPRFLDTRGLHIDISRHFFDKEQLKQLINVIAMHKLNTLHLHLTDDQGWRIPISKYPKLITVGSRSDHTLFTKSKPKFPEGPEKYLSKRDIKELIRYARKYNIQIIPEIDMPGHMAAAIAAYPNLKALNDDRSIPRVIRIDRQGLEFCKAVLTEINELFEHPKYIHIGFDEVNLGRGENLIHSDEDIARFATQLTAFIKKDLKTTPIVWCDAFTHGLNDPDTTVQWWRSSKIAWWKKHKYTIDESLLMADQPFILSPAHVIYFDMKNTSGDAGAKWAKPISVAECYNWDPVLDLNGFDETKQDLLRGLTACVWTEHIKDSETLFERILPRIAAFSENAWSMHDRNSSKHLSWVQYRDEILIPYQLKRYDAMGWNYWSKNQPSKLLDLPDKIKEW
ncbi:beta-N-acetylhexosaminidase [Planctomycetota bacterium]|nr:beta-N-acetylhexosaminidase [Planctomycetota bacterium]